MDPLPEVWNARHNVKGRIKDNVSLIVRQLAFYAQPDVRLAVINILCQALDMSAIISVISGRVKARQASHDISGGISGKPLVVRSCSSCERYLQFS